MFPLLAVLPLLLISSAFFSGSETALFSLSDYQRRELARSPSLAGSIITRLLGETRPLLITLLMSNMVINVLFFVITTVLLIHVGRSDWAGPLVVATLSVVVVLALILFGEVLPKLVAARSAETVCKLAAVPLWVVHRALSPLRLAVNVMVITPLARLIAPREKPPELSSRELEVLLELSQQRGLIDVAEEQMLQQVLELGQLSVRHLMTPRVDMKAFDLGRDLHELYALVRQTRLSHIPLYQEDLDHIVGFVGARPLLLRRPTTAQELKALTQPVLFVPEQQRADRLLVELRRRGSTLAIVVDEYGGTAGLVTLEDVVEHMVGEIAGPYAARQAAQVQPLDSGRWRVSADLPIEDWRQTFGEPGGVRTGVSTIGGLVMARLGRLPRVGDRIHVGNVEVEVMQMEKRRLELLGIRLLSRAPAPGSSAPSESGGGT